jgi:hypothetical protein
VSSPIVAWKRAFGTQVRREHEVHERVASVRETLAAAPAPALVIGSAMVLRTLEGLSDRGTAEALTFDLRWKAACGFGLTRTSFHASPLKYWRKHRAASKRLHG